MGRSLFSHIHYKSEHLVVFCPVHKKVILHSAVNLICCCCFDVMISFSTTFLFLQEKTQLCLLTHSYWSMFEIQLNTVNTLCYHRVSHCRPCLLLQSCRLFRTKFFLFKCLPASWGKAEPRVWLQPQRRPACEAVVCSDKQTLTSLCPRGPNANTDRTPVSGDTNHKPVKPSCRE